MEGLRAMTNSRKGQSAMETMAMVGIALAFIVPVLLLFFSTTGLRTDDLSQLQAKRLAQGISDEAGKVWYQDVGAKRVVVMQYPDKMANLTLEGNRVVVTLQALRGGPNQIVASTPMPIADGIVPGNYYDATRSIVQRRSPSSYVSSGLIALVFYNNGTAVNVYRMSNNLY